MLSLALPRVQRGVPVPAGADPGRPLRSIRTDDRKDVPARWAATWILRIPGPVPVERSFVAEPATIPFSVAT